MRAMLRSWPRQPRSARHTAHLPQHTQQQHKGRQQRRSARRLTEHRRLWVVSLAVAPTALEAVRASPLAVRARLGRTEPGAVD